MLWYKSWLETRIRLWIALGYTVIMLAFFSIRTIAPAAFPPPRANVATGLAMFMIGFVTFICAVLAQAGIASQAAFQALKGLHGSTQYTLSLPVSRFRLLAVRAGLGWLEMTGVIAIVSCGIWFVAPSLVPGARAVEMVEYVGTLIAFASSQYCLSVMLATFLDDQWRMGVTMAVAVVWWLGAPNLTKLPAYADIFRAMGPDSPLFAHAIPWNAMAFSLALAAVFFFVAFKIAQRREY